MNERAEALRLKIAYYRRWLGEGLEAQLARQYLREIQEAEMELANIAEPARGAEDGEGGRGPEPIG